jgi:TetR/AcrR family transcriptional regulator, transcriptional repressor for nem operon
MTSQKTMARGDTRERVLDAGFALFSTSGFNATGVKEIAERARVPKGSFYTYFESKDALGCAVIERQAQQAKDKIQRLLEDDDQPVERLRRHFRDLSQELIESKFVVSCLIGRFSAEVSGQSDSMRERLAETFQRWSAALARVVEQAARQGLLAEGLDPKEVADFLLAAWEGAVLRARVDHHGGAFVVFEKVAFAAVFRRDRRDTVGAS